MAKPLRGVHNVQSPCPGDRDDMYRMVQTNLWWGNVSGSGCRSPRINVIFATLSFQRSLSPFLSPFLLDGWMDAQNNLLQSQTMLLDSMYYITSRSMWKWKKLPEDAGLRSWLLPIVFLMWQTNLPTFWPSNAWLHKNPYIWRNWLGPKINFWANA